MTDRGWLCPRCEAVNAPSVLRCGCAPKVETWYDRAARDMRESYRTQQVAQETAAEKLKRWTAFGTCDACAPYKGICTHLTQKPENDQ
jgi:hypothetical protein